MTLPPFPRLLEEHRTDVYRFLVASVGRQAADDCFQETFLSALRAYPRLREEQPPRVGAHDRDPQGVGPLAGRARRPVPVEQVPEPAATEQADGDPELWTAVGALPPMQRAAVIHRYVLDLPYAEIAGALGISEEAARANAYEGRRKLRAMQEVTA